MTLLTIAGATPIFPVTDSKVNIAYTLTLTAPAGGGTGSGFIQAYTITPSANPGQLGTCAGATIGGLCPNTGSTNNSYILQVTY